MEVVTVVHSQLPALAQRFARKASENGVSKAMLVARATIGKEVVRMLRRPTADPKVPGIVGPPAKKDPAGDLDWTPPSWEQLVRAHGARVYRLAYRLTGIRPDAEDLTQDVFARVFRSLHRFGP